MSLPDIIIEKLAPHVCVSCEKLGSALCTSCLSVAGSPPPSRCAGCKSLTVDNRTCSACKKWLPATRVFVATVYEGTEARLLRAFKFELQRSAAKPIAKLMTSTLPRDLEVDYMTWIPTAPARRRARGFDHMKLLARELSKNLPELDEQRLLSRRSNVRQLGSTRQERLEHMENEFFVTRDLKGSRILLIDDVVTTGASMAAASKALKDAGAFTVIGLVYAQKT